MRSGWVLANGKEKTHLLSTQFPSEIASHSVSFVHNHSHKNECPHSIFTILQMWKLRLGGSELLAQSLLECVSYATSSVIYEN